MLTSNEISRFMCMPFVQEPDNDDVLNLHETGVFIGNSQKFNMPVFINPENTLNPHMLICGMTGGGKTFLARSIVARLHVFLGANIIVVDFTGEYAQVMSNLSTCPTNNISGMFGESIGIFYSDLHGLKERQKIMAASNMLDEIADLMRSREYGFKRRLFILLDEAWKLVENNKGLEAIIREGRKYGIGLITSSQLLHDTNSNILSNMATLFIFKTTSKSSLERLAKSYNLSDKELLSIQNLDLGGCFLIQLNKSGSRSAFQIRKVIGINESELFGIKSGANMEIKIEKERLYAIIESLCGIQKLEIIEKLSESKSVDLTKLISLMIMYGAERAAVLKEIKKMGFTDHDIADSFSIALNVIDNAKQEDR